MSDVHNLLDDMALSCDEIIDGDICGSTKFNLLKSGKIECGACGHKAETKAWLGMSIINDRMKRWLTALIAMTGDDLATCIQVCTGMGLDKAKDNGMDFDAYLERISNDT